MNPASTLAVAPPMPVLLAPGELHEAPDRLLHAYNMPCTLVLQAPVVNFSVGSLMSLEVGSIVETSTQHNEDLALEVNGQVVGMVEFDVVGDNLAVRLTSMA